MNVADIQTVIDYASLAPSVHNTQPWIFSSGVNRIEIRADRTRTVPIIDPTGRQLAISCGAAIEFCYLAIRGLGHECSVRLLPEPGDRDLLAALLIGPAKAPSPLERQLMEAIPRRYTDRGPYVEARIRADVIREIHEAIADRHAWLRPVDQLHDRLAVAEALSHAEDLEASDPQYGRELAKWLRPVTAQDGIPAAALAVDSSNRWVADVPLRDFAGTNGHPAPGGAKPPTVEHDALLAIGTEADVLLSWLQAGRALGWILLRLTVEGLAAQPLGQVIDVQWMRLRLGRQLGLVGPLQFLLRVGIGQGRPTTGRRDFRLVDVCRVPRAESPRIVAS